MPHPVSVEIRERLDRIFLHVQSHNGPAEVDSLKLTKLVFGLACVCGIVALGILWPELPHWRLGGTRSVSTPSVSHTGTQHICPGAYARIVILGDSHVLGSRMGNQAATETQSFGKVLERTLPNGANVAVYGAGGDTSRMGEERWSAKEFSADLVMIAYGTNDAAPRGWLRRKSPIPIAEYKASLERQIAKRHARSQAIILLAPPPAGSSAIMARLAPYRTAMQEVGREKKITVFDPADAFASCLLQEPLLTYDALHMNAAGHACLGQWLARRLCPTV